MKQKRYSTQAAILSKICLILTGLLIVVQYWMAVQQSWVLLLLVPGIVWYSGQHWNVAFIDGLMLIFYTLASAFIIPAGGSAFLALGIILLALNAWQLINLSRRLFYVQEREVEARLFRRNISRLGIILLASLVFGGAALVIKLELRFWALLGLALLAILGLSQLVSYLNQQGN